MIDPPTNEIQDTVGPHHNLQLVPYVPNNDTTMMNHHGHSTVVSTSTAGTYIALTVNQEFPLPVENDAVSHAVIVIPPSSSDLSEATVGAAPPTLNINVNVGHYPATETLDEQVVKSDTSVPPAESVENLPTTVTENTTDTNESKSPSPPPLPPPKQLKRSASFAELTEKGVDFEDDTFDRIRKASAGMEFQGKQNLHLKREHRHSFGHIDGNVEWFRGGNKRPCPRAGWLTRMASGQGETGGTPASGMYRTTNGFTFQC